LQVADPQQSLSRTPFVIPSFLERRKPVRYREAVDVPDLGQLGFEVTLLADGEQPVP
jgi:hypothetical protein